jgi:hypothetical protein
VTRPKSYRPAPMDTTEAVTAAGVLRDSGGALGDDLRLLAAGGRDAELRRRLRGVANTASQDDLGLTPLMYAVSGAGVDMLSYAILCCAMMLCYVMLRSMHACNDHPLLGPS